MIQIRKFNQAEQSNDSVVLWKIKYDTIHRVNIRDYTQSQVSAWAPTRSLPDNWLERIRTMDPFIAESDGKLLGFADLQSDGYIDHFFCHLDHQRQGIGKALMQALMHEGQANGITRLYSHVSITARPFFEHFGFIVLAEQSVAVKDQHLTNFIMEKTCVIE